MAIPRVITTPAELVKFIRRVLGDKWSIGVQEQIDCTSSAACSWLPKASAPSTTREFRAWVILREPVEIHASVTASTFAGLVKAVDETLWEKIREQFEKKSATWSADPDLITQHKPAIESKSKPAQKRLSHKKPAVMSKQLLLPSPASLCCNWPGCESQVKPHAWGCDEHWERLPPHLQELISLHYRPGERSRQYLEALAALWSWIRNPDDVSIM